MFLESGCHFVNESQIVVSKEIVLLRQWESET